MKLVIKPKPEEANEVSRCSICQQTPVGDEYPGRVCKRCDALAFNDAARPAAVSPDGNSGDNPVYIDGRQCWRIYGHGGYVTMLDGFNCRDLDEFCRRNKLPLPPEP